MKITHLTWNTIDRLAALVDLSTLSPEEDAELERLAYCANMGAHGNEEAWTRFVELADRFVPSIELSARVEKRDAIETAEEPAPETAEEIKPTRTREEVVADILNYFEENEDTFTACLEELDSYNGYLGDDRYFDMEELAEFYHDADPIELLNRAYYGYAEDSCTVDQWGTKRPDPFNPNADYFRYNGYGNLVSSNYKDYSDHLDHYAVDAMQENRSELFTINDTPKLSDLFDELENAITEA